MTDIKVIKRLSHRKSLCECSYCGGEYETNHYDAVKSELGDKCKLCKSASNQELNQDLVRKFYNYDPNTGVLTARLPQHQIPVGKELGYPHIGGYLEMSIGGKPYLVHRIIWLYQTGYLPEQVDHIDHIRTNNKWENLREVNNQENTKNTSLSANSTSGINGVSYMKSRGKYRATIMVNRKQIHLGLFDTIEEAKAARAAADIEYDFHKNHGST